MDDWKLQQGNLGPEGDDTADVDMAMYISNFLQILRYFIQMRGIIWTLTRTDQAPGVIFCYSRGELKIYEPLY